MVSGKKVVEYTEAGISDFKPTHAIGLIVTVQHYDKIGMDELQEVKGNHATMKRHYGYLGIDEVIEVEDSFDDFDKAFKKIHKRAIDADLNGGETKLLICTYFAGHGSMYNGATMT